MPRERNPLETWTFKTKMAPPEAMNRAGPSVNNKQKSVSDADQGWFKPGDGFPFGDAGRFFADAFQERDQ